MSVKKSCAFVAMFLWVFVRIVFGDVWWDPSPRIGSGYEGAHKGAITSQWSACTVNETKYLTADRASGDEDTLVNCFQQSDSLSNYAPIWTATVGTFVGDDWGTSVQWRAPEWAGEATFGLYEDDLPNDIGPDESGSRDDAVELQDVKTVSILAE